MTINTTAGYSALSGARGSITYNRGIELVYVQPDGTELSLGKANWSNYTVGDDRSQQTGLIAEEVNEIMPALVVYDKQGDPQTVKYHDLPVLLLNELQKAIKRIEILEAKLEGK